MLPILYPPTRPQSIGEVLDTAFRIFKITLLRCLPYGVLATVAGQLQNIYTIVTGRTLRSFTNSDPIWWLLYVLGALLGGALLNAIFVRQATMAAGTPSLGWDALKEALRKTPATLAMGVLGLAVIGVCLFPLLF